MYLECEEGNGVLRKENIFYDGNTSTIYKNDNLLYKIYKKREPYKRSVLDILIANETLRTYGVLPNRKIRTNLNNYGMVMKYIPNTITFREYLKNYNILLDEMIDVMITLSDNLKIINSENIHFSDLHHNNILITKEKIPLYIDFDDAVVKEYGSTHISAIAYNIHEVANKSSQYEDDLIKYGNLDQESLFIMFFNYLLGISLEKKNKLEFYGIIKKLGDYFPTNFVEAIYSLKTTEIIKPYKYYLGDFLKEDKVKIGCKILRRSINEYNSF